MRIGIVLVCAGSGKRLKKDKVFLKLKKEPLFSESLKTFKKIKQIKEIVVVLKKKNLSLAKRTIKGKNILLVEGGRRRQDSVLNGLRALGTRVDCVLVHDGARPFVTKSLVSKIIRELKKNKAVIPAIRSKDTLKLVEKGYIKKTLKREDIWSIQTPQGFKKSLLIEAHKRFKKINVSDDAKLIELLGKKVKVIEGDPSNFKITYPEDIVLAKALMQMRSKRDSR